MKKKMMALGFCALMAFAGCGQPKTTGPVKMTCTTEEPGMKLAIQASAPRADAPVEDVKMNIFMPNSLLQGIIAMTGMSMDDFKAAMNEGGDEIREMIAQQFGGTGTDMELAMEEDGMNIRMKIDDLKEFMEQYGDEDFSDDDLRFDHLKAQLEKQNNTKCE